MSKIVKLIEKYNIELEKLESEKNSSINNNINFYKEGQISVYKKIIDDLSNIV